MKTRDIIINQLIEIELEFSTGVEYLPSRVEGLDKKHLHISMPMRKGVLFPLRIGQDIKIIIKSKKGNFAFFSKVVGRIRERIPLLIIDKPQKFIKVPQKRTYVRLEVALPIFFRILSPEGNDEEIKKATTVDISAGGALILTPADIEEEQKLELQLELPGLPSLNCKGHVVRILKKAAKEGDNNKAAIEYDNINEGQRDRIFKFIFDVQRQWIKKGIRE